jgi:hypothetical protein
MARKRHGSSTATQQLEALIRLALDGHGQVARREMRAFLLELKRDERYRVK